MYAHNRRVLIAALAVLATLSFQRPTFADEPFVLSEGDRVAFVGATMLERDRHYGQFETALRIQYPGVPLEFRNLSWPGDTTYVRLRPLNFGSFEENVEKHHPTVIFVCYGVNESFRGPENLDKYLDGYRETLDELAETKARLVLVAPNRHEEIGPPFPPAAEHNANLEVYVAATQKLAQKRGLPFVDLFHEMENGGAEGYPLTDNGLHLTNYGYWLAAQALLDGLNLSHEPWRVELTADGEVAAQAGTTVTEIDSSGGRLRLTLLDQHLPFPAPAEAPPRADADPPQRELIVTGLPEGQYTLLIDDEPVGTTSSQAWAKGVILGTGPSFEQARKLRDEVVQKNLMFFHRWRAHNGEYIYGRRSSTSDNYDPTKDGGNSGNPTFPREMAEFDRLINESDERASQLSQPVPHRYEIVPAEK